MFSATTNDNYKKPVTFDVPSQRPLEAFDWISAAAGRCGSNVAQIDLASGRRFTYAQMHQRVGRLAAYLQSLGVSKGDRVAYLMLNSSDVFEVIFATWRIGAVAVALNWRLTAEELDYIVGDAAPGALIHDRDLADLARVLRGTSSVTHWIETGADGDDSEYERALAKATPLLVMTERIMFSDISMLMYSSGTTGRPKGVVITHQMQTINAWGTIADAQIGPDSTSLCFMPLFHIAGVNGPVGPCFLAGATVAIVRAFEPGKVLELINDPELGITHFVAVPAIYQALKAHPAVASIDFSRIITCYVGASAVPGQLIEWWRERGLLLREAYGLTESAGAGIAMPAGDVGKRIGICGKPSVGFEFRIMSADGTEAKTGEGGELWMRGPVVTPGYWNRPETNADSFVDGWFRTGDIVSRDDEGFYKIQDRIKDMYISGGENVYPAEVENILYNMEQIAEVAVIGVPDSKWGESGCAVVALSDGAELTIAEIEAFLTEKLAKFKQPAHIAIVDALPRTASGKVRKFELRQSIPDQLSLN